MIRIFKNLEEYNAFTNNGQDLVSGDLYWVKENKRAFFLTNNIDGEIKSYDMFDEIPEEYIVPSGNIAITENGDNIDVTQYASASVNVPIPDGYIQPSGNKEITANGTNIDVNNYATASVNVPIPEGYIVPSGNKEITANGTNIDVNNYATASVNVPIPDGYIVPSGNISITENGEGIDVKNYATATVNVPSTGGGNEDLITFIEGYTTTLTIPEGTTTIGSNIFQNYTKPQSVIIPDSVNFINMNAFDGCTSLTDVRIGSGVTKISYYAFQHCTALTSITVLATKSPRLNAGAFDDTNNCPIYVPAASVDAYKAAASWSAYADRIQAIGGGGPIIN